VQCLRDELFAGASFTLDENGEVGGSEAVHGVPDRHHRVTVAKQGGRARVAMPCGAWAPKFDIWSAAGSIPDRGEDENNSLQQIQVPPIRRVAGGRSNVKNIRKVG
jgi:hypothetical protein